ncbi:MAG TPA: hypothetical protein VGJ72_03430 [Polaromonas sp.]
MMPIKLGAMMATGDLIITEVVSPMMKRKSPHLIKRLQLVMDTFFRRMTSPGRACRPWDRSPDTMHLLHI